MTIGRKSFEEVQIKLKEDTSYLDRMDRDELYNLAEELIEENNELKGNYYPNLAIMIIIIFAFTVGLLLGIFGGNF